MMTVLCFTQGGFFAAERVCIMRIVWNDRSWRWFESASAYTQYSRQMAELLALEAGERRFRHIHGGGVVGTRQMLEYLREIGVDRSATPELEVREYIRDMGLLMRAADLVICRAGASTISELTALGVPAIIVPSPNVTGNHQEHNARVLSEAGGAVLVLEKDCSARLLYDTAREILSDPERRGRMSRAMAELGTVDAAERIYAAVMALRRKKGE